MRLGINLWPQNTTWPALREHALLADRLRFDSLWVWDHFYSIAGDPHRPNFEGWQLQPAYAAITQHVKIGCLVSSITHRHPAVLANMASTLDHISNGRAILGIGAGWNALEHNAYGIDLGTPRERSDRFAEGAKIIRALVDGKRVTHSGRYYELVNAEVLTRPLQSPLPILVGGGGERRTLRTAARYAQMWHAFESPEVMKHKIEVLRKHCEDVGRDPGEIDPIGGGWVVVREDPAKAKAQLARVAQHHGMSAPPTAIVGGPDEIAERIAAHWRVGVKGFIVRFAEPFDDESIERIAKEVRPRLMELVSETPAPVSG
ncbi:MAG TPA: LLM class flavin-dependent oxidoreductase [Candidatus Limnocylindria bacterium]|jgi:alkanesulfonate monooxygenase SsuD/methylene tetrahydromethanopterin reductase-like flavin-dependent oxidoreductase (luciferase family)|nr:LLM class flavin-dependent oxidoreductase [Candidatus Limnocylindria bacterium]